MSEKSLRLCILFLLTSIFLLGFLRLRTVSAETSSKSGINRLAVYSPEQISLRDKPRIPSNPPAYRLAQSPGTDVKKKPTVLEQRPIHRSTSNGPVTPTAT